jgi:uncharacterized protein YutE (UPF0331/DUF86 family)
MSLDKVSKRIVVDRISWISKMLEEIDSLPLENYEQFSTDKRNIWSAESCLRRALEALMDLGRHIAAKGFGQGVTEYKEIGNMLAQMGVLSDNESVISKTLAGYRNRMVYFYHEILYREFFEICTSELSDIKAMTEAIKRWMKKIPKKSMGAYGSNLPWPRVD